MTAVWIIVGIVAGLLLAVAAVIGFAMWLEIKAAYPDRHEVTGKASRGALAGGLGRMRKCLSVHHGEPVQKRAP